MSNQDQFDPDDLPPTVEGETETKEEPKKREVYGDDYFAARGYRKYKPGEEELKSYIWGNNEKPAKRHHDDDH